MISNLGGLFSFRGAIGRGAFLTGAVACVGLLFVGLIAYGVAYANGSRVSFNALLLPAAILVGSALLSLVVRRLRDMGWPVLYGLVVLAFVSVVGGGLLGPLAAFVPPLGGISYPIMIGLAFPGLALLVLWPRRIVGGGLEREIQVLRERAVTEGRLQAREPADTATPRSDKFGRRSS